MDRMPIITRRAIHQQCRFFGGFHSYSSRRSLIIKVHVMHLDTPGSAAIARGLKIKRNNAVVAAMLSGCLACIFAAVFPFKLAGFLFGLGAGFLYANAFEYFFHRCLLHLPTGFFAEQHDVHHSTGGTVEEMSYVNFAGTPWAVLLLFVVNAVPVVIIELVFRAGLGPGMFVAFAIYFVVLEEVNWRVHLGNSSPSWLQFSARHHLAHHAGGDKRFNVFLPVFDRLFGLKEQRGAWRVERAPIILRPPITLQAVKFALRPSNDPCRLPSSHFPERQAQM